MGSFRVGDTVKLLSSAPISNNFGAFWNANDVYIVTEIADEGDYPVHIQTMNGLHRICTNEREAGLYLMPSSKNPIEDTQMVEEFYQEILDGH